MGGPVSLAQDSGPGPSDDPQGKSAGVGRMILLGHTVALGVIISLLVGIIVYLKLTGSKKCKTLRFHDDDHVSH